MRSTERCDAHSPQRARNLPNGTQLFERNPVEVPNMTEEILDNLEPWHSQGQPSGEPNAMGFHPDTLPGYGR